MLGMNWKQKILGVGVSLLMVTTAQASDVRVTGTHIHHHYKDIYKRTPVDVKVCYDKQTSGDKTGDTLGGAILGGILGKALTGNDDGAAIGAIFGGIVGHDNSNATGGTKTFCKIERRFEESKVTVYSHSTITFISNGTEYRLRFQR